MDLAVEAGRLRLDVLAVRLGDALAAAGVPHALLKGPTTARWLYDVPRTYRDVDLLVPFGELPRAVAVLRRAGLARPDAGRLGEEAPHSLLLHSTEGFEVDLHVALPAMTPAGDLVWDVLGPGVVPFDLDVGTVPALDLPGRCVVLALHALNSPSSPQAREDLDRARRRADAATWRRADELAHRLGVADLFGAGLALADAAAGTVAPPLTRRAYLRVVDAPPVALGLERVAAAPWRRRPLLLARELVPSRGFMHRAHPGTATGSLPLVRAHLRRWRWIARQLPAALQLRRQARAATAGARATDRPGAGVTR